MNETWEYRGQYVATIPQDEIGFVACKIIYQYYKGCIYKDVKEETWIRKAPFKVIIENV